MISVSVKQMQLADVFTKAGRAERRVKEAVTLAAREDTKPYVPYVGGDLRRSVELASIPEQGLLIYGGPGIPYARAQYYGLPNKTWPGTTMQWFEASKAANIDKWIKIADLEAQKA
jgi:hypothetical protein